MIDIYFVKLYNNYKVVNLNKIIIVLVVSILFNCVLKENKNFSEGMEKSEYIDDLKIKDESNKIIIFESEKNNKESYNIEWKINKNIIGIYIFSEFLQFDFNSRSQTQNQILQSRITFEEHFSKGAIIIGIENGKYYMQYSYPKYSKEYFEINSPIVSGKIIGGSISDYFEYTFNNDIIEFYYNRIYEDRDDEYRNLLMSTGIFKKINITGNNIYQISSYDILVEEGRNINLENILNSKIYIFKEDNVENYIVYYNIPEETIVIVNNLEGVFIHYLGEHISSYEHSYYFKDNKLCLHVKIYAYMEMGIIHEYYIEYEEMQNGT